MNGGEAIFYNDTHDSDEDTTKDMYFIFQIGDEEYGVEVMHVTEVIALQKIVKVPDTPDFVRGVINLRGQVIPVMDVRIKFGMETLPYTERTCIVIVTINQNAVGLVVDVVNDVVSIIKENITPPSEISREAEHHFIKGFGKIGEEIKILIDIRKLIDEDLLQISSGEE